MTEWSSKRLRAEAGRLDKIRRAAAVPEGCGSEIPVAPGRGPLATWAPLELMPDGAGGHRVVAGGWRGRRAVRALDAFDRMANRGGLPFTLAQVSAGRHYRALVERLAASGFTTLSDGPRGGGGEDPVDRRLRQRERLDALDAAIGAEVALAPRRASARARQVVTVRQAMRGLLIDDLTVAEILDRHGWSRSPAHRVALRGALSDALDRMVGCYLGD